MDCGLEVRCRLEVVNSLFLDLAGDVERRDEQLDALPRLAIIDHERAQGARRQSAQNWPVNAHERVFQLIGAPGR